MWSSEERRGRAEWWLVEDDGGQPSELVKVDGTSRISAREWQPGRVRGSDVLQIVQSWNLLKPSKHYKQRALWESGDITAPCDSEEYAKALESRQLVFGKIAMALGAVVVDDAQEVE